MTSIQRIAQVFGWVFVVMAIWGALLTGTSMDADLATADRLWGLFPINFLHNLVHLAVGLWGIAASRSRSASRSFTVLAGTLYIVLVVLGLFFPDGFGLVPLGGNDLWLHAFLGAVLLVAGLTLTAGGASATVEPAGTRTVVPPTTASSPEGTVTRPPAHPVEPGGHAKPGAPEPAGSEGAAEAAPPPPPPDEVVDERPPEPEGTVEPRPHQDTDPDRSP